MIKRCDKCGHSLGQSRSSQQSRYYWGVLVGILAEELGNSSKEMHAILKIEKGLHETIVVNGKRYEVAKSTTEYTTAEFEDYLTQCRAWASEQGYFIPLPNEGR